MVFCRAGYPKRDEPFPARRISLLFSLLVVKHQDNHGLCTIRFIVGFIIILFMIAIAVRLKEREAVYQRLKTESF